MNVVDHGHVIVGICIGQAVDSLPLLTRHGKPRSQVPRIPQVMILARATEISRCIRQACAHPVRIHILCHAQWHFHRSRPRLPHRDSPHGRGSPVSRRKLCGCRVARCVHIRKLCEQEEARRASSAQSGLSTNLTVRRGTNSTSTRLSPERGELSANSAVRRGAEALRTAREIRRAVFPGIPSPIRHSWSFWLVVGQGARYTNTP